MKKLWFILISALIIFVACNQSAESTKNEVATVEEIDMNGPEIEMNVISFSIEDRKTEVEIINRTEYTLNSVSGRLVFIDKSGEPLTTATGRIIDSPFQKAQNPHIVQSKSKATFVLGNQLNENVSSILIEEISAKTTLGNMIKL